MSKAPSGAFFFGQLIYSHHVVICSQIYFDFISAVRSTSCLDIRGSSIIQKATKPTEGAFLRVRAAKIAPEGRLMRVFKQINKSALSDTAFLTAHQLGNVCLVPPNQYAAHDHRRQQHLYVDQPDHLVA